jgi:YHS domain-containing protein
MFGLSDHIERLGWISVLIVLFALWVTAYPAEEGTHVHGQEDTITASEHVQVTNVMCPVMPDMKTDPDIFTDYEGKRVYFCCRNCRAAFVRNPEKYLSLLPQFGGTINHAVHEHKDRGFELTLARFIKPIGITTLSLLVLTVTSALLRRRKPKLLLKWHKRLGITALVFASIHAILVLIAH